MAQAKKRSKKTVKNESPKEEVIIPAQSMAKNPALEQHKAFLAFCRHGGIKRTHTATRQVERTLEDEIIFPVESTPELFLFNRRYVYPEAIPFLFNLEGCPKKLFLYLLLFEIDFETGEFLFNSSIMENFKQFCGLFGENYNDSSIKQAIKHLRKQNIALNLNRGKNRINPLITGGKSVPERKTLIKNYSESLLNADLKTYDNFYPKY